MNSYYVALVIMWIVLWTTTAAVLGPLPDVFIEHLRRWPRWGVAGVALRVIEHRRVVLPAALAVWSACYLLSYAPIRSGGVRLPAGMMDFYVPVQWVIDETPLREPLLRWAELYGTREQFASDSAARARMLYWGSTPPYLYAFAWGLGGLACVVGPAWLIRLVLLRFSRLPCRSC